MNAANVAVGKPKWLDPRQKREIVPHGFRSTFRDWAAERGYADAVAEAALAHKVPDAVIAAYKRTTFFELRKKLMDDWAAFATSDPAKTGDNVVELRAAQ
jgi:integrase